MANKSEIQKRDEIRKIAEGDLLYFAQLVSPLRVYGEIHEEVFRWLSSEDSTTNQLLLLARGHQKSHCMAVWCAWWITRHPETTILYISATAELAEQQLVAIKNILDSDVFRMFWPDMLDPEEGRREKWSATKICVDHPARKIEGVRDPTVRTAGLTTNTTGLHADVVIGDDVVVPDNAYTAEGRKKVASSMSQTSSIKNAGGMVKCCGTTYHPRDIYSTWKEQKMYIVNDDGEIEGERLLWDLLERPVEIEGNFVWPRTHRTDGKAFGFNHQILAQIKAEYIDRVQFHAQYYLDPNDPESERISKESFQYYNPKHIQNLGGRWAYNGRPLNVYASVDFAYSLTEASDYTAIAVIGIDADGMIYVLDIDRFKTDKISEYYQHLLDLYTRWEFKRLRAEVTAAQSIIVRDLKDRFTKEGLPLVIDDHRPNRYQGSKPERMAAVLEPRYENKSVWHYKGGYIPMLEEELVLARPPHDDLKDALAAVIETAIPPKTRREGRTQKTNVIHHARFGGGCRV
tara:strand:+ start:3165 stop:4712 length:1548 start_codon:yes stop_codon:yes gene_type:complete